jgi:DNA mismatch repair protein MutH
MDGCATSAAHAPDDATRARSEDRERLTRRSPSLKTPTELSGIEGLTAHTGKWLQVRPKAKDGRRSAVGYGPDGEWVATVPRGFYLRVKFTHAILRDAAAMPE